MTTPAETNVLTIPCKWCSKPTPMLSTKMCNECWELHQGVTANPKLAIRMLNSSIPGSVELEKFMIQIVFKGFNSLKETQQP